MVSSQWSVDSIQKLGLLSEYMKTSELIRLKRKLFLENWKISLSAADELAYLNTKDAISILIEGLKSENNFIRNASALGIRDSNNKLAFNELWNRIIELGPHEEIGTLIYAMEMADCSRFLLKMLELFFIGNYEVKSSVSTIIDKQIFLLTTEEMLKSEEILESNKLTFKCMNIKYKIINEA